MARVVIAPAAPVLTTRQGDPQDSCGRRQSSRCADELFARTNSNPLPGELGPDKIGSLSRTKSDPLITGHPGACCATCSQMHPPGACPASLLLDKDTLDQRWSKRFHLLADPLMPEDLHERPPALVMLPEISPGVKQAEPHPSASASLASPLTAAGSHGFGPITMGPSSPPALARLSSSQLSALKEARNLQQAPRQRIFHAAYDTTFVDNGKVVDCKKLGPLGSPRAPLPDVGSPRAPFPALQVPSSSVIVPEPPSDILGPDRRGHHRMPQRQRRCTINLSKGSPMAETSRRHRHTIVLNPDVIGPPPCQTARVRAYLALGQLMPLDDKQDDSGTPRSCNRKVQSCILQGVGSPTKLRIAEEVLYSIDLAKQKGLYHMPSPADVLATTLGHLGGVIPSFPQAPARRTPPKQGTAESQPVPTEEEETLTTSEGENIEMSAIEEVRKDPLYEALLDHVPTPILLDEHVTPTSKPQGACEVRASTKLLEPPEKPKRTEPDSNRKPRPAGLHVKRSWQRRGLQPQRKPTPPPVQLAESPKRVQEARKRSVLVLNQDQEDGKGQSGDNLEQDKQEDSKGQTDDNLEQGEQADIKEQSDDNLEQGEQEGSKDNLEQGEQADSEGQSDDNLEQGEQEVSKDNLEQGEQAESEGQSDEILEQEGSKDQSDHNLNQGEQEVSKEQSHEQSEQDLETTDAPTLQKDQLNCAKRKKKKRRNSCEDFQDFLDKQTADDEKMQKEQVNCANEPLKRPPSVALIDDDICQLTFLKAQFANLGAAVTTFASGSDFLNKGHGVHEEEICWDLVVVDYVMPVLNGIETIAAFTAEMLQNTKVCLLSGASLESEGQSILGDLGLSWFTKTPHAYRDIWQELQDSPPGSATKAREFEKDEWDKQMLDPFDASTLDVASPLMSPLEPVPIAAATEEDKDNYAQFWASQLMESKQKTDEYAEMVDEHDGQAFVVLLTTEPEQEPPDDFKAYMLPCSSEDDDEEFEEDADLRSPRNRPTRHRQDSMTMDDDEEFMEDPDLSLHNQANKGRTRSLASAQPQEVFRRTESVEFAQAKGPTWQKQEVGEGLMDCY